MPGGFPNWSSSIRDGGGLSPLKLTFRKAKMAAYTAAQFNEAEKEVRRIKEIVEGGGSELDKALEEGMCEVMGLLVFGSNTIEKVGCDKRETLKICEQVFLKQRGQLDSLPARSTEYTALLTELSAKEANGDKKRIRNRQECVNHAAAFLEITNVIVKEGEAFDEDLIKKLHKILCYGLDIEGDNGAWERYAGIYRGNDITDVVWGGKATDKVYFTKPSEVAEAMADWMADLSTLR